MLFPYILKLVVWENVGANIGVNVLEKMFYVRTTVGIGAQQVIA